MFDSVELLVSLGNFPREVQVATMKHRTTLSHVYYCPGYDLGHQERFQDTYYDRCTPGMIVLLLNLAMCLVVVDVYSSISGFIELEVNKDPWLACCPVLSEPLNRRIRCEMF
jgi:hypothetical protein